ncbi:hypothetical protein KIN20_018276 [Parelaphostrongylus tenuis]|uniref:Cysteine-rich motor neuron 1 protein n=1 Tax=Parelaphostrongylus tenuis TaxID=148309 RepID=A0AAD5QPE2_PARTN|nr:hypothetical protein KIN20_018276 [Parelaphostrongylus tenuis]
MKNETWQKDDCTTCTCSDSGTPICVKHMCRTECENPRKVEGQCCPVCDEPLLLTMPVACPSIEHCPLRCEAGLQRDERGCFQCECMPSTRPDRCPQLSEQNCDKQCAHGYMNDASGCVVCKCAKCPPLHQCIKHCLYGYETNSVGCPVCKCRAISRIEAKLTIPEKIGRLAGWDKCVSLNSGSGVVERDAGEWWSDGCRHCFCEQKQEYCSLISCAPRPDDCVEENWIQQEGACCPSCVTASHKSVLASKHEHTVCQSPGSGRIFIDGETWQWRHVCRVHVVSVTFYVVPSTALPSPAVIPSCIQTINVVQDVLTTRRLLTRQWFVRTTTVLLTWLVHHGDLMIAHLVSAAPKLKLSVIANNAIRIFVVVNHSQSKADVALFVKTHYRMLCVHLTHRCIQLVRNGVRTHAPTVRAIPVAILYAVN